MEEKDTFQGDPAKTEIISKLFKTEENLRDDAWRQTFLENIAEASFTCSNPQVINGPDGFPYFVLNTPDPEKPSDSYVIKDMVPAFLLEHGLGVVINPGKQNPDWVFSYGDIVNYHLKNEFYTRSENWGVPGEDILDKDEEVLVGQPSEYILPEQTRKILRMFFENLQVNGAKILLLNRPKGEEFIQQLVFNLSPDKFKDQNQFNSVMRYVSWFLPKHYAYASIEEATFGENFHPL